MKLLNFPMIMIIKYLLPQHKPKLSYKKNIKKKNLMLNKKLKKLEFLIFLQNIEQVRLNDRSPDQKEAIKQFLSQLTLKIEHFPSDDQIILFYKENVQK